MYGGLAYELNDAHNTLAEYIITSSAKTFELHAMRDQVEMDFQMQAILKEADRLAHGGKKAVEKYRKKHHLDVDIHGEIRSAADTRITYRSEKSGHVHHTTLKSLPTLLAKGEVTHDTLAWQLGMPLHAVPLWQCEEHFDMHSMMAAHVADTNSRLAEAGIDPDHPSAPSVSDLDVPVLERHDKLAMIRLERATLTKERDEYAISHEIDKLADVVEALEAIEAYEKLLTGEEDLLPLSEDGTFLHEDTTSVDGNILEPNTVSIENPLHPTNHLSSDSAINDWWTGKPSECPFVGATMESIVKLRITGPPPRDKQTKRTLKPGDKFTVLNVQVGKTSARLEVFAPDRMVGWISPMDAERKPTVKSSGSTAGVRGHGSTKAERSNTMIGNPLDDVE